MPAQHSATSLALLVFVTNFFSCFADSTTSQSESSEPKVGFIKGSCAGKELLEDSKGSIGFLYAFIAVICFGSNFVPIKRVETKDGVHFSVVMTTAVWLTGLGVQMHRVSTFRPYAMLGGALWATGNVTVSIILQTIGLGMGMLIWGMANMLTGWSSGHFGLLGIDKETVSHPALNYVGVVLAVISLGIYYFVETTTDEPEEADGLQDTLLDDSDNKQSKSMIDNLSPVQKKVVGVVLSVLAGIFYGSNFDPPQSLIDHHTIHDGDKMCMVDGWSHNSLDYVFSHFCGIFAMTQLYYILYCIVTKNKPFSMASSAYLPSYASGFMWAVAQICWFMANDKLEIVIAFPLVTTGPGIIGALWGIFMFGEIQGKRNFMILGSAIALSLAGVTCIALSK
mmetsp:Transcript_20289/g.24247  ORF Transcript_20289/g.24247 Transcript_20289/m.24247 type:complete len:395 (+) Transcript_20289:174-1358(+)|eukprot:CAMPEP_0197843764 /NCGR_PEP_ID=MMETSP1438-20131217/702_1 /TAXON_ID=1461541 /ORGANISM="Pterosperma sp., Strain CCMP1384" /LENGTH=394 /DNA_ID=CAMNT_0043454131 /DNA_START=82 /DNA_END=1266 /DNA_ORIENTATION=+